LSVIEASDRSSLTSVARTVLSESTSQDCEKLAPLIVEAVLSIPAADQIDLGNFSVERVVGGAIGESFFMKGVAMPHELGDPFGPRSIRDARIALVKGEINERKPETWRADTRIQITGAFGISAVRAARYSFLTGLAKNVARSGATVLFIEKGIDPIAIEYLSRRGIMIVRRVVIEGLQRLALATGAQIVYDLQAISSTDLGFAGLVESRTMNNEEWVFVEGCRNPKAATFVVKGENEILLHSTVRLVRRSVKTVREAQRSRRLVYGGGAWEMSLVQKLRRLSSRYEGRQQLAIDGFADALEAIPATLAKNAGMDVIATVAALRASHAAGDARVGIDSRRRKLADMGRLGVLDPFSVKRKILLTAFGVGAMLIRIDSMILQHQLSGEERILKEREKHTDPERIEKRRRDYGGMEKLDWPRWRPSRETRIVNR
jgi:chaperonin GroEL (HSP60 family)